MLRIAPYAGRTVHVEHVKRTSGVVRVRVACAGVLAFVCAAVVAPAVAEHEMDHRFVVEGYVCKSDGQPATDVEVTARDTRASIGKAAYTDSSGYYRIQLHLHNDNAGDPVVVSTGDQERKIRAEFDPKDLQTERKTTVTFGSGCDRAATAGTVWLYYGLGIGAVAVIAFMGVRMLGRKKPASARGKKSRK